MGTETSTFQSDIRVATSSYQSGPESGTQSISAMGAPLQIRSRQFLQHPTFTLQPGFRKTATTGTGIVQNLVLTGDRSFMVKNGDVHLNISGTYRTVTGNRFDKEVGVIAPAESTLTVQGFNSSLYKKRVTESLYAVQKSSQGQTDNEMTIGGQVIWQKGNRTQTIIGHDSRLVVGSKDTTVRGSNFSKVEGLDSARTVKGAEFSLVNGVNLDVFAVLRFEFVAFLQLNFNAFFNLIIHNIFRGIQVAGISLGLFPIKGTLWAGPQHFLTAKLGLLRTRLGLGSSRSGMPLGPPRIP